MGSAESGRVVRFSRRELDRWARAVDRPVGEWVGCRSAPGSQAQGILWLEFGEVGAANDAEVAAFARVLGALTHLAERLAPDPRRARLDALARDAGAWIHDLRHAVQIVGLEAERVSELPAESRSGAALDELKHSVADARRLCDRALQGEPCLASARSGSLRPLLAREAASAAALSGRAERVGICIDCADELTVHTDPATLARVVRNLVLNALDASADGGEVRLSARLCSGAEIELSVRDRGRGMAVEDVDRLLRCGESGRGGTGFGSTSTADCVSVLGGHLQIQSRLGAGTSVSVRLPRKGPDQGRPVLVVSGDARRRDAIVRRFAASGWCPIEAIDGPHALDALMRRGPADVVLVRGTPGPGLAAVHEAARRVNRRVAVISVSDGGIERSVQRAIELFQSVG